MDGTGCQAGWSSSGMVQEACGVLGRVAVCVTALAVCKNGSVRGLICTLLFPVPTGPRRVQRLALFSGPHRRLLSLDFSASAFLRTQAGWADLNGELVSLHVA